MFFNLPLYRSLKKIVIREQLIKKDDKVVVAVSGGADSLSLLILLNRLRMEPGFAFSLHVAHLNHGLRGKSAAGDARFVRRMAGELGLSCTVGKVQAGEYKKKWGLSLEDAARQLRYRFLLQLAEKIKADSIAVGHNRDDQAETVLLNILRGTGPDGLMGMKFGRKAGKRGIILIRPLLGFSRQEIEAFCSRCGLCPRIDETNLDPQFLRNRIRREILPLLEKRVNPNLREGLFRLSRLFELERDYWEDTAAKRFEAVLLKEAPPGGLIFDRLLFMEEHPALQGRMIRLAAGRLLGSIPRGVDYQRIQAALNLIHGSKPRGAVSFPGGMAISRDYDKITAALPGVFQGKKRSGKDGLGKGFLPAVLSVPGELAMDPPGTVLRARLSDTAALLWPPNEKAEAYLDYDEVLRLAAVKSSPVGTGGDLQLLVRRRMPGDRFYPLGAPGKKKLKDYLIDRKISWEERDDLLLVLAGDEIVWVAGRQISHLCRIIRDTKKAVVLTMETIQS